MNLVKYMKDYDPGEHLRKSRLTRAQLVEELPHDSRRLYLQFVNSCLDDLAHADEQLKAVVDIMKMDNPALWTWRDPLECEDTEWVMELAYLLGCADGKREERAKRKT